MPFQSKSHCKTFLSISFSHFHHSPNQWTVLEVNYFVKADLQYLFQKRCLINDNTFENFPILFAIKHSPLLADLTLKQPLLNWHHRSYHRCVCQRWNRSGFYLPNATGKFQNLRRLTGFWPAQSTVFFHCSMHLMENLLKGGHERGVKICDSEWESQKKKRRKFFACFAKITQF